MGLELEVDTIADKTDIGTGDNKGMTSLHLASLRGHLEVAQLLIEKGRDVTVANKDGWMPLYCASEGGHLEVAVTIKVSG